MGSDIPSGPVTFLFTDIEGSTALLRELGPVAYEAALAQHRRVVREATAKHRGSEMGTEGDAFFITFESASGAIGAARDAQTALGEGPIKVRMGLHTGRPLLGREGYVGEDVHLGARIAAAGHGGQVLLSEATRAAAGADATDLGEHPDVTDLGEHRLKDFPEPVSIFQLGSERFPPLKTISNTNLPRPGSSFVGRDQEVAQLVALVRGGARLISLTGPGGSGKSRLAIEAAGELVPDFKAGVFWVGLAPVRDPELVVPEIAQTLGARADLAGHIGERAMLLVLDNLEQVVASATELASLIERCPNLHLLVTSRELLRVRDEREFQVTPLVVDEAVALFCARAQSAPDAATAELCERLDRLPLAIELAAARSRVMSAGQILARLAGRLDLLTGGRDADPRQRTLRATIAWSHDLLSETEQSLFARLAVFAGGFSLEAVEAVCDADLDDLQSLVEKSLVRYSEERFSMLETIREYANERLEASSEHADMVLRHYQYFQALADSYNTTPEATGPSRAELIGPNQDNFRVALDRAMAERDVERAMRLATALEEWLAALNPVEGARRIQAILAGETDGTVPVELRARALRALGGAQSMTGDAEEAIRSFEASLELSKASGNDVAAAELLHRLAFAALYAGDTRRARALAEQGTVATREVGGGARQEAMNLQALAQIEATEGNYQRALELTLEAARIAKQIGWIWWEESALVNAAQWSLIINRHEDAEPWAREALALARQVDDDQGLIYSLGLLAWSAAARGDVERAGCLWGAVENLEASLRSLGGWPGDRAEIAAGVHMDQPDFEARCHEGRHMSLEQAIDFALGTQVVKTTLVASRESKAR